MFCDQCGKEIPEGAAFCPHCGAKTDAPQTKAPEAVMPQAKAPEAQNAGTGTPKAGKLAGKKKGLWVGIGIAAVALIAAIVAAVVLLVKSGNSGGPDGESTSKTGKEDGEEGQEDDADPLYGNLTLEKIDLEAQTVTPGAKAPGTAWDSTLFYWLEDVDTTADTDGNIAGCTIWKTQMEDAKGGGILQYEVYRDASTGEIYKIVSIRDVGDGFELVDYYYKDGKPNFTFKRNDSVYTPTYATIDKTGERYYFADDVMARWRIIRVPGEIGEYTLDPGDTWYSQSDYFSETEEVQGIYDEVELRELNAAYNTYNAIVGATGIGTVEGRVENTLGEAVPGRKVRITRASDGVLLYEAQTDEEGRFSLYVYLDGTECVLTVAGGGEYRASTLGGLLLKEAALTYSCGSLVLHKTDGDEYPVRLNLYDAESVSTAEDGSLLREALAGASVNFREGRGMRTGEVLVSAQASEDGSVSVELPSGAYTAEISVPGYATTYLETEVAEQETLREGYLVPALEGDRTAVLLTWEGMDTDLDLTVFTPYQSTGGDMAYIGSGTASDSYGNSLHADNGAGCEVAYLDTAKPGSFKVYVNDYADSLAGNYTSDALRHANVHIYIYNSTGLVAEYTLPLGQSGVVWEVAEINRQEVTPSQRLYTEIAGKSWWVTDKNVQSLMNALENDLGAYMRELVYEERPSTVADWVNGICQGEPSALGNYFTEGVDRRFYPSEFGFRNYLYGYCLAEEDCNKMIYSMTGDSALKISDVFDAPCEVYEGVNYYPAYGNAPKGFPYMELENPRVTATGSGTWDVTFDAVFNDHEDGTEITWSIPYKAADLTFHVVADPASVFDGYRVTGAESVYSALTQEAFDAYREKIQEYDAADTFCSLYDVNGDAVPELWCYSKEWWHGTLYTYVNGGLDECSVSPGHNEYLSFVEGGNVIYWVKNYGDGVGSEYCIITENGFEYVFSDSMTVKEECYSDDTLTEDSYDYWVNGQSCTAEEYSAANEQFRREYLGDEYQWRECGYGNTFVESEAFTADAMLSYLQDGWKQG